MFFWRLKKQKERKERKYELMSQPFLLIGTCMYVLLVEKHWNAKTKCLKGAMYMQHGHLSPHKESIN